MDLFQLSNGIIQILLDNFQLKPSVARVIFHSPMSDKSAPTTPTPKNDPKSAEKTPSTDLPNENSEKKTDSPSEVKSTPQKDATFKQIDTT